LPAFVASPEYARLLARIPPKVIRSEEESEFYRGVLEELERRGDSLGEAEKEFAALLRLLIADFEGKRYRRRGATPVEVLTELMAVHNLKQKDLAEVFGSASIVSEVLHGKRKLNAGQIRKLSRRFGVSPEVFF
jgi:HTH-type transcriptional regulator/antitoxin HigA